MVTKVMMPKFGLSMETGVVGSWLVEEGAAITKGSALAEITTDKISNTCESPVDGILRKRLIGEGDEAACGDVIAVIADTKEEDISGDVDRAGGELAAVETVKEASEVKTVSAPVSSDVKITPRAKKVAEEKGLVYKHIKGTGLLGAITISDLKQYGKPRKEVEVSKLEPPVGAVPSMVESYDNSSCKGEDRVVKMSGMEGAVSKAMMKSLSSTAQTTIATEAEITNLVTVYKQLKGKYTNAGVKLSYTAMIIKSVAMALENHETIRMTMADEGHFRTKSQINIGVAVDVPGGLVVPVIRDANLKDLRTIAIELQDISTRAKSNQLKGADMGDGVITITNLGMFGITYFTPVLNLPESAILGVGAITEKLLVKDGAFAAGCVMNFSMTHDHRVINGAPAARFLNEVVSSLQDFKWI